MLLFNGQAHGFILREWLHAPLALTLVNALE
jgi:hypothetical protein